MDPGRIPQRSNIGAGACVEELMPKSTWMTRRRLLLGLGFSIGAIERPDSLLGAEFCDLKPPEQWTKEEIGRLLTKSPWSKDASIVNTAQTGPLSTPRNINRRGRNIGNPNNDNQIPEITGKWQGGVRWDSALPVREALKTKMSVALSENYIINVFGNVPSPAPTNEDSADERKTKFDILQERTRLERKDDPFELKRVELAPATPYSQPGTLFYFSRVFPITLDDKQVTFVTKIGPLELKCKFTLKEMLYRGNLEL
jgi:hypothetical protein